jgi:DNA replication protein DnaC
MWPATSSISAVNQMRDKLQALLTNMRFDGMAAALDTELERAEREGTTGPELLYRLLSAEAASQRQRSLAYRLSQARLPWDWTLETFPFEQQPSINRGQIKALAGLDFLSRANNIVLTGKTGTGKTGIAIGILREACLNGYRGRFYDAQDLLDELYASLADRSTSRLLKRLTRLQPLVIDKVDNLTVKPEQANAFFRLIDQRYNRVSTIITTSLDLTDWYDLFEKKHLVDALLDRLRHRCITITIDGPSLRSPEGQASTAGQKRLTRPVRQHGRRGSEHGVGAQP